MPGITRRKPAPFPFPHIPLTKTIARCGHVHLLRIDDLGYMELDHRGAELLFQVLSEHEEKNRVAIAAA